MGQTTARINWKVRSQTISSKDVYKCKEKPNLGMEKPSKEHKESWKREGLCLAVFQGRSHVFPPFDKHTLPQSGMVSHPSLQIIQQLSRDNSGLLQLPRLEKWSHQECNDHDTKAPGRFCMKIKQHMETHNGKIVQISTASTVQLVCSNQNTTSEPSNEIVYSDKCLRCIPSIKNVALVFAVHTMSDSVHRIWPNGDTHILSGSSNACSTSAQPIPLRVCLPHSWHICFELNR